MRRECSCPCAGRPTWAGEQSRDGVGADRRFASERPRGAKGTDEDFIQREVGEVHGDPACVEFEAGRPELAIGGEGGGSEDGVRDGGDVCNGAANGEFPAFTAARADAVTLVVHGFRVLPEIPRPTEAERVTVEVESPTIDAQPSLLSRADVALVGETVGEPVGREFRPLAAVDSVGIVGLWRRCAMRRRGGRASEKLSRGARGSALRGRMWLFLACTARNIGDGKPEDSGSGDSGEGDSGRRDTADTAQDELPACEGISSPLALSSSGELTAAHGAVGWPVWFVEFSNHISAMSDYDGCPYRSDDGDVTTFSGPCAVESGDSASGTYVETDIVGGFAGVYSAFNITRASHDIALDIDGSVDWGDTTIDIAARVDGMLPDDSPNGDLNPPAGGYDWTWHATIADGPFVASARTMVNTADGSLAGDFCYDSYFPEAGEGREVFQGTNVAVVTYAEASDECGNLTIDGADAGEWCPS